MEEIKAAKEQKEISPVGKGEMGAPRNIGEGISPGLVPPRDGLIKSDELRIGEKKPERDKGGDPDFLKSLRDTFSGEKNNKKAPDPVSEGVDAVNKTATEKLATESVEKAGKSLAKEGAEHGATQALGKGLGKAAPLVGPAIEVGLDKAETGSVTDRDVARIAGGTVGGALAAGAAGAALGSVVPGAGTAVGFVVGVGASAIGGYLAGKASEAAYDASGAKEQKLF